LANSLIFAALAERPRWPLWLPVVLGTGAGLYFALPSEPPVWVGWAAMAAGLAGAVLAFRRPWPLALVAALLIGFGIAKLREAAVATPVLNHPVIAHLTGRVMTVEPRPQGIRVVLDEVRSGAVDPAPRRVRIALRTDTGFRPGQWLSLTARLDAPPPPTEPGAGDLGRALFFDSIGAVGFAYGHAHLVPPARPPTLTERFFIGLADLRLAMTARIAAALPGSPGGIAGALVTGERGEISEEDETALRDAGLAHVLAIAGLHMALVGGGIFWLVRAVLAAIPAIVLAYPIKKWAAGAALAASCFYLAISGAAPPAVRAFVMLAMVMLAILFDRPALTMRSLALAASLLLLARPESIFEPGFQMSFAAVAALIAVAEWEMGRERLQPRGLLYRYVHGIAVTSLVGSLATMPFALFHFGRATPYALLGNLIAMPVMGFWVMPAAALSVMLMPFGAEQGALAWLGQGIGVMTAMGRWVSGLPGAVRLASAMPLGALVLIALGGLWLAIWQRRWRWWGIAPLLLGCVWAYAAPRPAMLVAPDAQTVAIRGRDGLLHFVQKPADRFVAREWLRRDGDGRDIAEAVGDPSITCDGVGCAARGAVLVAISRKPEALAEDCVLAKVVISAVAAPGCKGPAVVIDRDLAARGQGWRVTLSPQPHAESVRMFRGERPWLAASGP
jgi:competence protein ComEC